MSNDNEIAQSLPKHKLFLAVHQQLIPKAPYNLSHDLTLETISDAVWSLLIARDFPILSNQLNSQLSLKQQYILLSQIETISVIISNLNKCKKLFNIDLGSVSGWEGLGLAEKATQASEYWGKIITFVSDFCKVQDINLKVGSIFKNSWPNSLTLLTFFIQFLSLEQQKNLLSIALVEEINRQNATDFLISEMHADINGLIEDDHPCLIACEGVTSIDSAIKLGANINIQSQHRWYRGDTALIVQIKALIGVRENDCSTYYNSILNRIDALLLKDADLNIKNAFGKTALSVAVESDVLTRLAEHDNEIQNLTAEQMVLSSDYEDDSLPRLAHYNLLIEKLINKNADLNIQNNAGETALFALLKQKKLHMRLIKLFIQKKANINVQASNGQSVLMLAAQRENQDLVQLLLDNGAKIELQDALGKTALVYAREGKNPGEITEILMARTRSFNLLETSSLMQKAIEEQSITLLENLYKKSEFINAIKINGYTPITYALDRLIKETQPHKRENLERIIYSILEHGASTAQDDHGNTPWSLASKSNSNVSMGLMFSIGWKALSIPTIPPTTLPTESGIRLEPLSNNNAEKMVTLQLGTVYPNRKQIQMLTALGFEEKNIKGIGDHYYWTFNANLPNIFIEEYDEKKRTCQRVFHGDKCIMETSSHFDSSNPIYIDQETLRDYQGNEKPIEQVIPRSKPKRPFFAQKIALGILTENQLNLFLSLGFPLNASTEQLDYLEKSGENYYLNITGFNKNIEVICTPDQEQNNKHHYEIKLNQQSIIKVSQETPLPPSAIIFSYFQTPLIPRPIPTAVEIFEDPMRQMIEANFTNKGHGGFGYTINQRY